MLINFNEVERFIESNKPPQIKIIESKSNKFFFPCPIDGRAAWAIYNSLGSDESSGGFFARATSVRPRAFPRMNAPQPGSIPSFLPGAIVAAETVSPTASPGAQSKW